MVQWIVVRENNATIYYDPDYYRQLRARGGLTHAPATSVRETHAGACRDALQRILAQARQRVRQDDDVLLLLEDDDDNDVLLLLED